MKKEFDFKHHWLCMECADSFGAKWLEGHCCTVTEDVCPYCNVKKTIIPYVDFDWVQRKTRHLRD